MRITIAAPALRRGLSRPSMTAQTQAQRTAAKKARRTAQGLARYSVWIPDTAEAREAVKRLAEQLRE